MMTLTLTALLAILTICLLLSLAARMATRTDEIQLKYGMSYQVRK